MMAISTERGRQPVATQFQEWGRETLRRIDADLAVAKRRLYREMVFLDGSGDSERTKIAFLWPSSVQLSALAAAARVEPDEYSEPLIAFADALQAYWRDDNRLGGYNNQPQPQRLDRYYDDNAWMALALIDTFVVTGERRFLDRARAAVNFALSGEDDVLGGGIYGRENGRQAKHASVTAPTVVAALRLYQKTGRERFLKAGRRLAEWTTDNLQAPNGLFFDNIDTQGGLSRRQLARNAAMMIRAYGLLQESDGDDAYLEAARRVATAARRRWVNPDSGAISAEAPNARVLCEAFLLLHQRDPEGGWSDIACAALKFLYKRTRGPNKRYPKRWDQTPRAALTRFRLIDQASAARAYWVAARIVLD